MNVGETESKWVKAGVTGGLWASFELSVGNVLYNMPIPFSGTIMASLSVILLTAIMYKWKTGGIIWRAGIICGLLKSLTPTAVLLGPLAGIMMIALTMELFIFLLGKNLLAYITGGIGALLSALALKLIKLLFLFGTEILHIFAQLFYFLRTQLGMEQLGGKELIVFVLAMYMLMGAAAAITGIYLGRYALRITSTRNGQKHKIDISNTSWSRIEPGRPFRILLLSLHMVMILATIILLNKFGLSLPSLLPTGTYILFILIYYKSVSRRLLKPFFWILLLLLCILAVYFLAPAMEVVDARMKGFLVGVEMAIRAIVIVGAFSAISVEIRNPKIFQFLTANETGKFYKALSISFLFLPQMLDNNVELKSLLKNPGKELTRFLCQVDLRLESYKRHLK